MAYLKFQLKGILKNKFNYIPLILSISLILICLFSNAANYDKTGLKANLTTTIQENREQISKGKHDLENETNSEASVINIKEIIEMNQQQLQQAEEVINQMDLGNWQSVYGKLLKINSENKQIVENSKDGYLDIQQALENEGMFYQYLKKANIPYQDPDFPTKGLTFMMWSMNNLLPLLVVISIIYLLTQVYSGQFYERINKSSLLPYTKSNAIKQNLLLGIGLGFSVFFLYLIISLVISSAIFGIGSSEYPVLSYAVSSDKFYYQNMQSLYLPTIILFLSSLVFCILLVYWLNDVLRNQLTALFISLLLILSPMLLIHVIQPMSQIAHLLPTTYLNSLTTTTGMLGKSLSNPKINFITGLQVTVFSCVLMLCLIIVTQIKIKK